MFVSNIDNVYDLVVVGTGFASSFFLAGWLKHAAPTARAVVLERGPRWPHARQVAERRHTPFSPSELTRRTGDPAKTWMFTVGFGGGSNCWWANVPRFLPADFQTQTRFGVGRDWPFGYDDLAPYYEEVERAMSIAGPPPPWPYPRAAPYPQPPHRMNAPEERLKAAWPNAFFAVPTGRARTDASGRTPCCANGQCHLCPVDAKFSIQNSFMSVYEDPRVSVLLEAEVLSAEVAGDVARAVRFRKDGRERTVRAELVVLGANAVFNPVVLKRSGLDHPLLGRRLHEQIGLLAEVKLEGLEGFGGSTSVTGHGYMFYDDPDRRREMAACFVETWNTGMLRSEPGKWLQTLPVRLVYEDLPDEKNYVAIDPENPDRVVMHYEGHGDYAGRAMARAKADLERMCAALPVEEIVVREEPVATEAHVIGTTVMGRDPKDSVLDGDGMHHRVRNLVALGSGNFPVGGPANPSLTISAHALRSADRLMRRA